MTPGTPADHPDLGRMRRDYLAGAGAANRLDESSLAVDWPTQFGRWFTDAVTAGIPEPNAMIFGTADTGGRPSARTVLLKDYDAHGYTLYTNYSSRKGREALANPYASLVFPWFAMHRQVVVSGTVERVDRAETESYFGIRPRDARLGAWASPQSSVIGSRHELDDAWEAMARRWPEGVEIPPPDNWGGLRVIPETVEFWQGRPSRLHDRLRYRYTNGSWVIERLAP